MAKVTHAQEVATGTPDSYTEHELSDPHPPVVVTRAVLGGELLSAGDNSRTSSERELKTSEDENQSLQSPAQTTDNPSPLQDEETNSVVTSTAGHGQSETVRQSAKKASAKKPARQARVRSTDDDFD